jgi:hypothetical protein
MSDKTQSLISGVIIPALQAIITGVMFALFAVAGWALYNQVTGWRVFFCALAGGAFIAWIGAVGRWRSWVDAVLGVAKPDRSDDNRYRLNLNLLYNDGQAGDFLDLPCDYQRLEAWCAGVAGGKSLGENHWTGAHAPFSKGEYHKLLDELVKRGLVRLRGRHYSSGYELTGKGSALAAELARRYNARLSPSERRYQPGSSNRRVAASERERERGDS